MRTNVLKNQLYCYIIDSIRNEKSMCVLPSNARFIRENGGDVYDYYLLNYIFLHNDSYKHSLNMYNFKHIG